MAFSTDRKRRRHKNSLDGFSYCLSARHISAYLRTKLPNRALHDHLFLLIAIKRHQKALAKSRLTFLRASVLSTNLNVNLNHLENKPMPGRFRSCPYGHIEQVVVIHNFKKKDDYKHESKNQTKLRFYLNDLEIKL